MATSKKSIVPTNQFSVKVAIPFPQGKDQHALLQWFNIQNCGKPSVPLSEPASAKHKDRAYKLHRSREYEFVFEIDVEGEWKFIGRKG